MEENIKFRSDFYYDLAAHKEYNKLLRNSMTFNTLMSGITFACMLFLLTLLDNTRTLVMTLIINGFWIVYRLVLHLRGKDGGIVYKQILHSNEDNIPHQIITLTETGIRSRNPRLEKEVHDPYENLRYMMESKNLLVIVTNLKMCYILDKRYITGGTREEMIAYLHSQCPKLKKRIKTGRAGSIISNLLLVVAVIGLILGGCKLLQVQERITGRLTNRMSYEEMAQELEELGITISRQTIDEIEVFDAEYAAEYGDYYADYPDDSKVYDLLYWEGCGIYDENTWDWTPSESGVYWFDMEVYNLASIYTDFLRGVSAMDPELIFTNVSEDYTGVDIEGGTGEILVSFDYQGERYDLTAVYDYDWFDLDMIGEIGAILASDPFESRLWFHYDNSQALLLYYGTDEQAQALEKKTGLEFIHAEYVEILNIF